MKERILDYMAHIDKLLEEDATEKKLDYEELKKEHLVQLEFFMHERLVHLLVTLAFAIFGFGDVFVLVNNFQPGLAALFVAIMILLIPYIMHYYLLENSVQKMYDQYDEMCSRAAGDNPLRPVWKQVRNRK